MHFIKIIKLILINILLSQLALADINETPKTLASSAQYEDEITVYGTSNPLNLFEYPGQVSIIGREEIELFSPSTPSDLLRDIPGLEFSNGPRRTGETPSIRGLSGDNVLILMDGARQSFSSGHDGRFFLDPDLLKKAEVVKGPASSLYGSGAVGGVLAFETVDAADLLAPGETRGARLRLGQQTVNDEFLGVVSGYGMVGDVDVVTSFGIRNSKNIELGSGVDLRSDDDIRSVLLKTGYGTNDVRVEASWQRFDNEALEPNNGQGVTTDNDVHKDILTDNIRINLEYNPASTDLINLNVTGYLNNTEVEEYDRSTSKNQSRDLDSKGINVRNASNFMLGAIDTAFTIGGEWYKDIQIGTDTSTSDGTRGGVPDAEGEFYGVFMQAEMKLALSENYNILFIPGIRYDHYESEATGVDEKNSDKAWSPRFALSLGNRQIRLFGNYSEGLRAPSINELYLDGIHFGLSHPILGSRVRANNNFVPNTNLKAEKTESYEGGVSLNFESIISEGDQFTTKASYYESEVEDFINMQVNFAWSRTCWSYPFSPCTAGTTQSSNLTDAKINGFELESAYDTNRFLVRASYSTIDGEDASTGADIGTLTPNRISIDARIKLPEWGAVAGTRLQLASDFQRKTYSTTTRKSSVAETRDGYVALDLYASWKPQFTKGVRLDFGIDNLLDKDYDRVYAGVSEPGINVKTAITFQKSF